MKRLVLLAAAVIYAAAVGAAGGGVIRGRVTDAATGQPVAGADVRIQASLTERATAGADGAFRIETPRDTGARVTVSAGAPAYYNAGVAVSVGDSGVEVALAPLAGSDDPAYVFRTPEDCRLCHQTAFDQYRDAGHRNAAKNAWVKDLYDGSGTPGTGARGFTFKGAHPDLHGDCAECHAPMAAAWNPGEHTDYTAVGGDAYEWGVSCDVCHKTTGIVHPKLPGVLAMTFERGSREAAFGPLPDSAPVLPGQMRAAYSPLHASSLLCAACHEDNNDHDFDGDYLDEGSVPSEATYSEWAESPYAVPGPGYRTCQSCHMQPKGGTSISDFYGAVARDPSQVHSHDFEGTTDDYVRNAATARVIASRSGGRLAVSVAVTNDRTGHHVPSGVTVRNMILLVTATDAVGRALPLVPSLSSVVPEWGGVGDPAGGYWAGLPGKGFAKILSDGTNDNVFFTEALMVKSDNRIPAGATDWSEYVFELPDGAAPARVEARLVYRRAFRDLVDLKGWALTGQGRANPDLAAPHFGVLMSEASEEVPPAGPGLEGATVTIAGSLRIRLAGAAAPFAAPARVEITDATGAWRGFSAPPRLRAGGRQLAQRGTIDNLRVARFWPDGAERFVRVSNGDGGATVVRLVRRGRSLVGA